MASETLVTFQKRLKNFLNKFNFFDRIFEPEGKFSEIPVVYDKVCPKCGVCIIRNNVDVCKCGYSFINEQKRKINTLLSITWILIIGFVFFIFASLSEVTSLVVNKLDKSNSDSYSVSPAGIQIIDSLKDSKYGEYIRTIYIHPKEKNKLMVLINPLYRNMMNAEEKEELKKLILAKWSEIYQQTAEDADLKPIVRFANFG